MTPLLHFSELTRSFFSLWTLSLVLVGLFSIVRSVAQKRIRFAVVALIPLGCSYFLWQVLFDVHLFGESDAATAISRKLCGFPLIFWLFALFALTAAALLNLIFVIRNEKHSVTPAAVKQCLDRIPCGVCGFRSDGRVLFSNDCMNRLCVAATGERLLDGNQLSDAAAGSVLTLEGRRWRFTGRDLVLDGEVLHELIASDVTSEYAKTEALRKDQEDLSRLNRELKEYTLGIDDTVRRQEILQAKVNIHDEMNRLMLSTVAAEKEDARELDRIFSLWEQNAPLLCMEAEEKAESQATGIEKLAEALKIRLIWESALPDALSPEQRSLFFSAAQEAIANAAKHTRAKTMKISFEVNDARIVCRFANDGQLPDGAVRFAGGLYNLSLLAQKQGAAVFVDADEAFTLSVRFPRRP